MDIRRLNLRHFLALAVIAECGRVSAAADRVCMSQSALTQALRNIERRAGVALFERAGFGVVATAAGECLVRRARRAGAMLDLAERDLRHRQSGSGGASPLHRHITTSQLHALVAVVATGSYGTAARRLGLAQPSVHRAAKDLEAALGVVLLPRAARGVEPTEAARVLARHAELVFAEMRQGFEEVRELQGLGDSRIAIGSLPLARSEFVPAAITRLLDEFPDAEVSILDGPYVEQLHALRYGQIDWLVGALRNPPPATDVVETPLFDQPLAVVVRPGHPLLGAGAPDVSALAELQWIAPRRLSPARRFFDAFFANNGLPTPSRVIECGSLVATRGLLERSDRAAMLSPLQVREDLQSNQLALLVESIPGSSRSIGVTVRDDWEPTRLQHRFAGILRELAIQVAASAR